MIRTFLDLSTGHLTPETRDRLDAIFDPNLGNPIMGLIVFQHPDGYGWFVLTPTEDGVPEDLPSDLVGAFACARRLECAYILFDADGTHLAGLPWYEED